MLKQLISFTDSQYEFIKSESYHLGISISKLVRRIVDAYRMQLLAEQAQKGDNEGGM
jgi:hypothetical protein